MYTGTHENGATVLMTRGREHLKVTNPPLFDYVEKLFTTTIPQAVAAGTTRGPEQRATSLENTLDAIAKVPLKKRTPVQLYTFAATTTVTAVATKDRAALEAALANCGEMRQRSKMLFGLVENKNIAVQADELAERIRSHLASLAGT